MGARQDLVAFLPLAKMIALPSAGLSPFHFIFIYQTKKHILADVLFVLVGEAGLEPARPQ